MAGFQLSAALLSDRLQIMRRFMPLIIPVAFGMQALNMLLLHLRHPEMMDG
ncbi:MAG TPA: hypothetical protein VKW08_11335 [Xanthobacteraceae bacterium]|nr:hypothetical protein [Xanthobacteraceae bacterium]